MTYRFESDRDASFEGWSDIAREFGCALVYGFARSIGNDYWISTSVVSANGELQGVYDKLHLAQGGDSMEKEYFASAGHNYLFATLLDFGLRRLSVKTYAFLSYAANW